jgi:hypothetical protein
MLWTKITSGTKEIDVILERSEGTAPLHLRHRRTKIVANRKEFRACGGGF